MDEKELQVENLDDFKTDEETTENENSTDSQEEKSQEETIERLKARAEAAEETSASLADELNRRNRKRKDIAATIAAVVFFVAIVALVIGLITAPESNHDGKDLADNYYSARSDYQEGQRIFDFKSYLKNNGFKKGYEVGYYDDTYSSRTELNVHNKYWWIKIETEALSASDSRDYIEDPGYYYPAYTYDKYFKTDSDELYAYSDDDLDEDSLYRYCFKGYSDMDDVCLQKAQITLYRTDREWYGTFMDFSVAYRTLEVVFNPSTDDVVYDCNSSLAIPRSLLKVLDELLNAEYNGGYVLQNNDYRTGCPFKCLYPSIKHTTQVSGGSPTDHDD